MRRARFIDRRYVRDVMAALAERGLRRRDCWTAAVMGACIIALDRGCMGRNNVLVTYKTSSDPELALAQSSGPCGNWDHGYDVFVPRLCRSISYLCRKNLLVRGSRLDMPTMLMAVAAHEVRHRLQYDPNLRMYEKGTIPPGSFLIKHIVAALTQELEDLLRIWSKDRDKDMANLVEIHSSPIEFDALVVEHLVMRRGPSRKTLRQLATLVRAQPLVLSRHR